MDTTKGAQTMQLVELRYVIELAKQWSSLDKTPDEIGEDIEEVMKGFGTYKQGEAIRLHTGEYGNVTDVCVYYYWVQLVNGDRRMTFPDEMMRVPTVEAVCSDAKLVL